MSFFRWLQECASKPNDRRRREWGSEPKRRPWRKKRGERVRKQGVLRRMEQDDYVFEWAMKNPIPATKKEL